MHLNVRKGGEHEGETIPQEGEALSRGRSFLLGNFRVRNVEVLNPKKVKGANLLCFVVLFKV